MAYYGFEHRYGVSQRDERGGLMGTLHVFASRAARDSWIDDGNPWQDRPGVRTTVKSRQAAAFARTHDDAAVVQEATV